MSLYPNASRFAALPGAGRMFLAVCAALLLCAWICAAFWQQDLRWSLPTPRPAGLIQPPIAEHVVPPPALAAELTPHVPVLLHFFNPGCPCSRFNLDHVRTLEKEYGTRVRSVFVVQGEDANVFERVRSDVHLDVRCVLDRGGEIAHAYGVYATPQAVVLDQHGALAYRGNYNSSRFCVDPATEFVRLALDDVLAGRPVRTQGERATTAYGCALPADETRGQP